MAVHAQHSRPLWLAALLTPFALPIVYALVSVLSSVARGENPLSEEMMRGLGAIVIVGLPVCIGVMFLVGLPLALVLRARNRLNAPIVCAAATLLGVVAFRAFILLLGLNQELGVIELALSGGVGFFMGAVFSLIAGIRFRAP